MTAFLYRVLAESGRYQPEVISLATSAGDPASVRLCDPATWLHSPRVEYGEWREMPYRHVGAYWAELEFQRYRPRATLDHILKGYDLAQFVVGVPPWACTANGMRQPVFLWTATTVWPDRASRLREAPLLRRWWLLLMARVAQRFERLALQRVRTVFALSQYTLESIRRRMSSGDVRLAVCGVDTQLFWPGDKGRGQYILSVGRFSDARKNVRLLVKAYSHLAARRISLPDLYLVGEPPLDDWLLRASMSEVPGKVRFLGPRYGHELAELYRNALFFVLSSDEEGLGIVVLEAMASGLPVVSTRCGGPETSVINGETGFLVPAGDAEALADAIRNLLDDPMLRSRMGEAARYRAEDRYSLCVAAKVFLDAYDEVLERS